MADNHHLADGNNDDDIIFVYTGGEQEVPRDVRRAKIDESIDTIPEGAFSHCEQLIEVEGHNKLKKIEGKAFYNCTRLRRITKMNDVIEIEDHAFGSCHALSELEFDKLEIIREGSFCFCKSLRSINLPFARRVGAYAFYECRALTDAVFGEDLEGIEGDPFFECTALRRIVIPLKDDLIIEDTAFNRCVNLARVDTVIGRMHKTISSLHMKSWRDEMREEIDRINQTLPDTPPGWDNPVAKTTAIQQWIRSVLDKMEHYKAEHQALLKEAMTLLELALWKAKLHDEEGKKCEAEEKMSQKAKIGEESTREEHRVTCGASIVVKNVLPFLALE